MERHIEMVDTYFQRRTTQGNGVVKDYFEVTDNAASIFVCGNDYLDIANNTYVVNQQIEHMKTDVEDNFRSGTYLRETDPHSRFEKEFEVYFGKQCTLTQSGYAANTGLMHALCEKGTHVYIDKFTHASFYEGLYLKGAKIHRYKHNDLIELESMIKHHGPGIIIVDSLFSNLGDFAPLKDIVSLKIRHKCILVVDESHTLGVYDKRGLLHKLGLDADVDYITASLAKAYCTRAGIILGGNKAHIKEHSLWYIFSSPLLKYDVIRLLAMFEVIKNADEKRHHVLKISNVVRKGLATFANVIETSQPSPIICIRFRDENECARLHRYMVSKGVEASVFIWPAAPLKEPMLRITVHNGLTLVQASFIINVIRSYFISAKL